MINDQWSMINDQLTITNDKRDYNSSLTGLRVNVKRLRQPWFTGIIFLFH